MTLPTAFAAPVAEGMVLRRAAATTPVLATARGAVHSQLRRRHRVYRRHEALDDAELVVHNFRERRKAVGRARSVADNLDVRLVLGVVHAADEHRHIILRRGRDDHLLAAAAEVKARL